MDAQWSLIGPLLPPKQQDGSRNFSPGNPSPPLGSRWLAAVLDGLRLTPFTTAFDDVGIQGLQSMTWGFPGDCFETRFCDEQIVSTR